MRKVLIILLIVLVSSCASSDNMARENSIKAMHNGNYSLIVPEKHDMAVLDVEGDQYELAPMEVSDNEERASGLSAEDAVIMADSMLEGSGVMLRAVTDQRGGVLGYEVYPPTAHGAGSPPGPESESLLLPNLLRIDYTVDTSGSNRVRITTIPVSLP